MNYSLFSKIFLRTPMFSFDEIDNPVISSIFKESIFLASPELYSEWLKVRNEDIKNSKTINKIELSVLKYDIRSHVRCTPFGLFAGISTTDFKLSNESKVFLAPQTSYTRYTRLDMSYLCTLSYDLTQNKNVKHELLFFPNSSIYTCADKYRYIEFKYKNSQRLYHLMSVDANVYLQNILAKSEDGCTIKELANSIIEEDITYAEALEFINELIDSQILISELDPNVTGKDLLTSIIECLSKINNDWCRDTVFSLKQIQLHLISIDSKELGITSNYYTQILNIVKKLDTLYDLKYIFQTDLAKPVINAELDCNFIDVLKQTIKLLNKLTPKNSNSNLVSFKRKFVDRYEDELIPIQIALDPEIGIGYGSDNRYGIVNPLIDDLSLPMTKNTYNGSMNTQTKFLIKKVNKSLSDNCDHIEITDEDIIDLDEDWNDLPLTFSALVEHYGDTFSLNAVGNHSAANLLARFCHTDVSTNNFVLEITKKEKELLEGKIVAEIIHLPESRLGNVINRPILRNYEIPFLAKSGCDKEYQISLQDILIGVKNGRVMLWSKYHSKEIIPRLSNAHNYNYNSLPIYHFLCDLQDQDTRSSLSFKWDELFNEFNYLPRLIYKNAILASARWLVRKEEIDKWRNVSNEYLLMFVEKFRQERKIPIEVKFIEGDNEMYINFRCTNHIQMLLSLVKNKQVFQLNEFLFKKEKAVVNSIEGGYTNQMIFSFYKNF